MPAGMLWGLAVWATLSAAFSAVSMLLNATGAIRFQAIVALFMALGSITLSIILGRQFGISGVIWGTVLAYVAISVVPQAVFVRRLLARGFQVRIPSVWLLSCPARPLRAVTGDDTVPPEWSLLTSVLMLAVGCCCGEIVTAPHSWSPR